MDNTKKKNIFGAVSSVMVIMVLSRLLSLLSVQIYMSFYGAGDPYLNIYSYAISIPNIIFTCIGTALSTVVIPIYVGHRANGEMNKAKSFADNIITVSMALTAALVLIGMGLAFLLPRMTEYVNNDETYRFCVKALMIVMPVMFFYALNYIFQGMLQAAGRFKLPAFVSVPSSLIVIGYVLIWGDKYKITGLLIATVIGLAMQALILIPPLIKDGYRYRFSFKIKDKDIIRAGKMTVPVLLGVGAYQFNMLYNVSMITRFGMVTLLTYVQNITLYMVLALIYSVTAVIYPKLTESASRNDMSEYKATLSGILMSVSALLIPMTFGFIGVRKELLELIAAWGKISAEDVEHAAMLLSMYAVGIMGIGLKEILDRSFYALGDTRTSAVTGVVIMAVNVGLSLVLMQYIGAYGIPLAYSIASLTGMGVLLFRLRKKIGTFAKGLGKVLLKCIVSSSVMLAGVWKINEGLAGDNTLKWRIIRLFVPFLAGAAIYFVMSMILRTEPVKDLAAKFFKRKRV